MEPLELAFHHYKGRRLRMRCMMRDCHSSRLIQGVGHVGVRALN